MELDARRMMAATGRKKAIGKGPEKRPAVHDRGKPTSQKPQTKVSPDQLIPLDDADDSDVKEF